MGLPKKILKNDIDVYAGSKKELLPRRQELLERITKSDPYLPDSILHDDLDRGMLDYVEKEFKIVSDSNKIPIIPKILTIQRWSELSNTWEYVDDDNNIQLPFISVVRKPDVQPGTNPSVQRTIPDRYRFHYSTVKTFKDGKMGADVYRIPQPIAVDISYEVTIVCNKFRDLNNFNKVVMQRFTSRQDYTTVKGHYIPIILEKIDDNSPIDSSDGRRFYVQTYQFTLLGFLIDSDEFDVKPAINRTLLLNEIVNENKPKKTIINKGFDLTMITFVGDGETKVFSVGEPIGFIFYVTINGLVQDLGVNYFHIAGTSKITFVETPNQNSIIVIAYYKGKNNKIVDDNNNILIITTQNFIYDGNSLTFTVTHEIKSVITVNINGLVENENDGFIVQNGNQIILNYIPIINSTIGITYAY
jgi:hypothetical protein